MPVPENGSQSSSTRFSPHFCVVSCLEEAGQRVHGTTRQQPLVRFEQTERATLQVLPSVPYELAVWKQVKLHRDGYIVFENAYFYNLSGALDIGRLCN